MPSLKALRIRINSVKSTQKITKAMKMVAASKLRRAQERAEAARPYAERMERMVSAIAERVAGAEDAPRLLVGSGDDRTRLLVVTTSDRGLCGGFNSTLVRAVRADVAKLQEDGKTVKVLCLGRKGRDQLKRDHGSLIVDTIEDIDKGGLAFAKALEIAGRIAKMYDSGEFDLCTIHYNRFKSVMSQEAAQQRLIPFGDSGGGPGGGGGDGEPEQGTGDGPRAIHEFEPDAEDILAELLPRNLAVQVYRALLESTAGEQASRMTAMENATRNAGEMIDKLTLNYNRTRQAAITKELIEIVTGAEAL